MRLERLEDRTVPATYYWVGAANSADPAVVSSWSNPNNWDLNGNVGVGVPGATDIAAFSATVPTYAPPADPSNPISHPINQTPVYDVTGGGQVFALSIDGSWTGNITVNNPLTVPDASEWDGGTITVAAGVTLTNSGNLALNNSGGPVTFAGGGTLANSGSIIDLGAGGISVAGTLLNATGGLFDFAGAGSLTGNGTFTNAGNILKAAGATPTTSVIGAGLQFSNSNIIDVEGGTLQIAAGGTSTGATFAVQAGATLDLTGGSTALYQGAIVGSYSTTNPGTILFGSGTIRLTGNATFNFPAGMFHWSGGTIDLNAHTLTNFGSITLDNPAGKPDVLMGNGTMFNQLFGIMSQTGAGGLVFSSTTTNATTLTVRGLYNISTDAGVSGGPGGGTFNISGTLEKSSGSGTSVVSPGVVNSQGAVYAQSGTLSVNGVVQQADNYLLGGAWGAAANSTLVLNGGVPIALIAATVTLSGAGASFSNLNGVLSENDADFTLFGGATLTTQAAFTNYSRMSVGAGCTFTADGVKNDAAGSILGGGTIVSTGASAPATLDNAGQLRPGSPPARLAVTGNYSQDATGSFNVTLNGPAVGTQYDQLVVNGNVNLGGALAVTAGYSALAGTQFVLIDNRGTAPVNGTFANLPEGSRVWSGHNLYLISYKGGDGNDVVLTALDPTPISVQAVQVNDGSIQRSEVRSITVTFTELADFAGGDANAGAAFKLRRIQDGGTVATTAAVSVDPNGRTVVTLTFSGAETDSVSALNGGMASLTDGRYTLSILSADITGDTNGLNMRGGGPNDNYISPTDTYGGFGLHLYRLFGDANGDGVVDATDVGQLKSTFNRNSTDPLYLAFLDADNSGSVDAQDVGQFKTRFNTNVVSAVTGLKFYVNPATGNDANDGLTPQTAWKTWDRLVAAVNDGTIPAGGWVNGAGAPADAATIALDPAKKTAWYNAYLAGDRYVNGASIYIDTSAAPLQVTAPLVLPPGCEILSATNSLTDLRVNLPISPSEVWTRPNATPYPDVWGTTSTTAYTDTGLYEMVRGQWAQLMPITGAAGIAQALSMLEANPGSFYVDPSTNRLYTHAILGGNPNTDGIAREYIPPWAATLQGRIIDVTDGRAYLIGGDGGFGVDPVTGQAEGTAGIGSGEWESISVIDSCQWSHAGKHTFSAVGNYSDGLVIFRNDVAEEGPGGVFVGYWSHFVDYSSYTKPGFVVTIYDGDSTVNGLAYVDRPGGTDANPEYGVFESHGGDGTAQPFAYRLFENCNFAGSISLGGLETTTAELRDSVVAGPLGTAALSTVIVRSRLGYRMPGFDGQTATITDSIIAPGSLFVGAPRDIQGNVTFNRCTFDLTAGRVFGTAWTRTAPFNLSINNSVILNQQNTAYGLVVGGLPTDSFTFGNDLIQGPTGDILAASYDSGSVVLYSDALAGRPGFTINNTRFVADARLDPTTYAPLPGSLAVGQAFPIAGAPDFTGTIWANRHTAGAMETLNPAAAWSLSDMPMINDVWNALPAGAFQDSTIADPASTDGDRLGGWVGQINGRELTQTGDARPVLTTIGGVRALTFDGSEYFNNTTVATDGGGLTMAFVVNFTATGGTQTLYSDAANGHSVTIDSTGHIVVDGLAARSSTSLAGAEHRIIVRESVDRTEIWVDGVLDTATSVGLLVPASMTMSLFNQGGSETFHGTLFGMAAVGEWITDADLAALDSALKT
jgi:hypothetical protein